jgi:hypothetical protein
MSIISMAPPRWLGDKQTQLISNLLLHTGAFQEFN